MKTPGARFVRDLPPGGCAVMIGGQVFAFLTEEPTQCGRAAVPVSGLRLVADAEEDPKEST